jgi:hypothetical protein
MDFSSSIDLIQWSNVIGGRAARAMSGPAGARILGVSIKPGIAPQTRRTPDIVGDSPPRIAVPRRMLPFRFPAYD